MRWMIRHLHSRGARDSTGRRPGPGAAGWTPALGIPFAVKDNIDVAGMPTTAACPDFAHTAQQDAFVVARLRAAGAIILGKANLDQFATGLVGLRTPYPAPRNAVDPAIVPGARLPARRWPWRRALLSFRWERIRPAPAGCRPR